MKEYPEFPKSAVPMADWIDTKWITVDCADGVERYVRAETLPAGAAHNAATARKTTNTSYAPLTRRKVALWAVLCLLAALPIAYFGAWWLLTGDALSGLR